jgi:hypothetical protein
MAGVLAVKMNRPIIIVRKGESAHGSAVECPTSMPGEGNDISFAAMPRSYIIVDDGIATGATVLAIRHSIEVWVDDLHGYGLHNFKMTCKGVFLYNQTSMGPATPSSMAVWANTNSWQTLIVGDGKLLFNPKGESV